MFEGDMIEGELEIGQAASLVESIKPAAEIVNEIIREFNETLKDINGLGPLK
jgi:enoyl-[acyl-carrier protein] reductase II